MMKKKFEIRVFKCPECGRLNYAAKRRTKRTPIGHVKSMWCPFCQKKQRLVQVDRF